MHTLLADVRYGIRMALRSPGFTAGAVLTLAVGIGATMAVYAVVNALLLRPLPFRSPEQLVRITVDLEGRQARDIGMAIPELFDLAQRSDIFAQVSGLFPINANLSGTDEPERIEAQLVSVSYFTLLGASAQLGRVFTPDDYHPGIAERAVISDSLWARRFGRDPHVLGRKIRLDNDLYEIIGVMPAGFEHPGRGIAGRTELWAPTGYRATPFREPARGIFPLTGALARLAPGVSVEQVQTQLNRYARDVARSYPADYPASLGWRARVIPLQKDLVGDNGTALAILMGAVALVLLIACANVANLLLARAAVRQRELAIRRALGAGAGRIITQLLAESSVLAFAAAAVALLVTVWTTDGLAALVPASAVPMSRIAVDARVVLFAVLVAIASVILFGVAPAFHAATGALNAPLRDTTRHTTASRGRQLVRSALAVAQCSLALVLLIGAMLLIRTFQRLNQVDLGFTPSGVLAVRMWMPQPNIPSTGPYFTHQQRLPFLRNVESRVRSLPGVEQVAWSTRIPLTPGPPPQPFLIDGRQLEDRNVSTSMAMIASPTLFDALRIPLRSGRMFAETDAEGTPPVALVNESFARRYFPNEDPIGRRLRPGGPRSTAPWRRIVGVVGDVRMDRVDAAPEPYVFLSSNQFSSLAMALLVKTRGGDPATLGEAIRREVRQVDRDMPVFGIETMEKIVDASTDRRRFAATLLLLFAGVAVVLALIGLYAVVAYVVGQRTHEIGIRVALGAQRTDVLGMILSYGGTLAACGIAIGLIGAALLTRLLRTLLFEVSATDPVTFIALPIALCVVAIAASYVPARRAMHINPIEALRYE